VRLHPTRPTLHIALVAVGVLMIGVAARLGAVVAFGGAMILAIAIGRALALVTVTRLRAAGFEMVWSTPKRVVRTTRGGSVEFDAELRNRGVDDVRGVGVRVIASSMLDVMAIPDVVDLPGHSRIKVRVRVRAKRVGRWGVHGMALEVRGTPGGGEGLYEVPLMFANPFGVEVFPRALKAYMDSPIGGRSRRASETGRPAMIAGEGDELRELRDHVPGDPFKRIAWRASARRGKLVVREMERDQRDVVWIMLDASVELWAGREGRAPLDDGVDEIAALAARHLMKGDRVGLVVTASRLRTWIPPAAGPLHALKLAAALTSAASMIDADRCELDEVEVAARVAEHARPLDPRGLVDLPRGDLDHLASRAESLRPRAPFAPRLPQGQYPRERMLRHYLASFGVEVPPRAEGERDRTMVAMAGAMEKLAREKTRPSVVYVWGPPPKTGSMLLSSVRKLRNHRIDVRWLLPSAPVVLLVPDTDAGTVVEAVEQAAEARAGVQRARGERMLRKLGVKVRGKKTAVREPLEPLAPLDADPPPSSGPPNG
jgi:uncharacterized protein (DUF58 family)